MSCDDYCCNHGCNQGRNCPARKTPAKATVREDVLAAEARSKATAAQAVLHLPSEDTKGGSHD